MPAFDVLMNKLKRARNFFNRNQNPGKLVLVWLLVAAWICCGALVLAKVAGWW